jgi:hypothetical protein
LYRSSYKFRKFQAEYRRLITHQYCTFAPVRQQKLLKYGLGLMGIAFTANGILKLTASNVPLDTGDKVFAWVSLLAGLLNIGVAIYRFIREWQGA